MLIFLAIVRQLKEMFKSQLRNPIYYWVEHLFYFHNESDQSNKTEFFQNLLDMIQKNCSESRAKEQFVFKLTFIIQKEEDFRKAFFSFDEGYFEDYKLRMTNYSSNVKPLWILQCEKELGNYQLAIDLAKRIPVYSPLSKKAKIEMACCFILLRDTQKATEIIRSLNLCEKSYHKQFTMLEYGRAFFDVGDYENSGKYFLKYVPCTAGLMFQELDCLCKILLLGIYPDSFVWLLKFYESYYAGCGWNYTDNLRLRYGMVIWCYYIKDQNLEMASDLLDEIIQEQKNSTECKLWFPEPLLMAKHWLIQGENDKALFVYRMIERFQKEFEDIEIPMILLNGTEVDINVEIAKCMDYEII